MFIDKIRTISKSVCEPFVRENKFTPLYIYYYSTTFFILPFLLGSPQPPFLSNTYYLQIKIKIMHRSTYLITYYQHLLHHFRSIFLPKRMLKDSGITKPRKFRNSTL
jgi:hypothetical protein